VGRKSGVGSIICGGLLRGAFSAILLRSGTCQPALFALKAEMLSLHSDLSISIDNPASSGDNMRNTCSRCPRNKMPAELIESVRIAEALLIAPQGLFPVL